MNESISDKAVCRTAPAIPGLSITPRSHIVNKNTQNLKGILVHGQAVLPVECSGCIGDTGNMILPSGQIVYTNQ